MRYRWRYYGNPDMVCFHSELAFPSICSVHIPSDRKKRKGQAKVLAEDLERICGVRSVYAEGRDLTIRKDTVFDWSEIMPAVLKTVTEFHSGVEFEEIKPPIDERGHITKGFC